MSPSHLPFPIQLITSNFSSVLIVFRQFLTLIALVNVDLCFWLILLTKANAVVGGAISATCLYYQCNQSIQVTDGITVMSLFASLQHKKCAAGGLPSQIVINRKLLYEFEKWCKFSSHVPAKSCKKKSCKKRPACTYKNPGSVECISNSLLHTLKRMIFKYYVLWHLWFLKSKFRNTVKSF